MIPTQRDQDLLARGATVIAATHRLARQLRHHHDRTRVAAGDTAWATADALPLDAWLRRTWESMALGESALGRRRLLSDDESRLVWRRVLASDGQDRLDAGVIIPLVAAGWRLCQAWDISPESLRNGADSDDTRTFARWVEAYTRELERRSWLDGAGLMRALGAAGQGTGVLGEALVGFAGFEPWTPALAALAANMDAAGTEVALVRPPSRSGVLSIVEARDENDELARAFHWAAGPGGPGEGDTTSGATPAIIVPNLARDAGRVRRIALDVLAPGWQLREPAVRPVALAVGRQLADYPLVCCALNLLQSLVFDVTFEQASLLLRSSYMAGADGERSGRARAELALRRVPFERQQLSGLLPLLGSHAPELAGRWQRATALADVVRGRGLSPGQWAGHFTAWLAAAGWPGDRGLGSEEFQAAEAWQRLLEAFAATDEVAGTLTLGAALGILGQQAGDRPFEPESAEQAIQVLSLQEAEGQDFRSLWVAGLTADQWPPPARPHPLVPLLLQKAAGIPEATPATLEAQTRRRLERLLASADHIVLSWPAEQDQARTLPSPLLAGLGATVQGSLQTRADPGGEALLHPDRETGGRLRPAGGARNRSAAAVAGRSARQGWSACPGHAVSLPGPGVRGVPVAWDCPGAPGEATGRGDPG